MGYRWDFDAHRNVGPTIYEFRYGTHGDAAYGLLKYDADASGFADIVKDVVGGKARIDFNVDNTTLAVLVAKDGNFLISGVTGEHYLDITHTDDERLLTHWLGYCANANVASDLYLKEQARDRRGPFAA